MAFISSSEISRKAKEQRKQERKAQREQDKLDRERTKKAQVSTSRRVTILETKTLSQTEAATLLHCVINAWHNKSDRE
jgi:hypothetical protein